MRVAEDVRFLKVFPVIHVLWCKKTPKRGTIEMTAPLVRSKNKWLPVKTVYLPFTIFKFDTPHDADPET